MGRPNCAPNWPVRQLVRAYRGLVWQRDPLGTGRFLEAFLRRSGAADFVIANGVVVVPIYGTLSADAAIEALQALFAGRKVIGLSSRGLLGSGNVGGGSFHCITREEPA